MATANVTTVPAGQAERRTAPASTSGVLVLVPAHNEEACIGATLDSLVAQSRPADRIVVVADNCDDRTAAIAESRAVEVLHTVGNTHRKAGALNFALGKVLPGLADDARVVIMDADSTLDADWIANAGQWLDLRPFSGAVCAVYRGRDVAGILPNLQRVDYALDGRRIGRRRSRVDVLTGVATMFTAGLLREVARERGHRFQGRPGEVYDVESLTEDFEITLAIRTMGYHPISPRNVTAATDLMTTWPDLRRQRVRWQRGTIETLRCYGFSSLTRRHWLSQIATYLMSLVLPLTLLLVGLTWFSGGLYIEPVWLLIWPLFYAEHILLAWRMGWRGKLLAVTVLPFWFYENFRISIFWYALAKSVLRREKRWI